MVAQKLETTRWLELIRAEYMEFPGLHLTKPQARRLLGLDQPTCDSLLDALVAAHFLKQTPRGDFVRATGDHP